MTNSGMPIKLKVWLDDVRPMPAHFDKHCYTASEAILLLNANLVSEISLDHDLGDEFGLDKVGTGYEVACKIEELAYNEMIDRIKCSIHSANPVGRKNMEAAIAYAQKCWEDQGK